MKSMRRWLLAGVDLCISFIALVGAILLRFDLDVPVRYWNSFWSVSFLIALVSLASNVFFKNYTVAWEYAGVPGIAKLFFSSLISMLVLLILKYSNVLVIAGVSFPGSIIVLYSIFFFALMVLFRYHHKILSFGVRTWQYAKRKSTVTRVLLIANSETAYSLIQNLYRDDENCKAVAIVEKEARQRDANRIMGVEVVNGLEKVESALENGKIQEVIADVSYVNIDELREINSLCLRKDVKLKAFQSPVGIDEYAAQKNRLIRDIDIEDLIGRNEIRLDSEEIQKFIKDKTVLVTGAAGSIGLEICRQVLGFESAFLIMLDICENGLFHADLELREMYPEREFQTLVASIQDKNRLFHVFEQYKPDIVFHAAAHKHVPLMEANPCEAIKNNIFGTLNVVTACEYYRVKKFIAISSDKAVNPANIMGATKRVSELIIQAKGRGAHTEMAAVRFGNVIGSNGSVIPLFQKQIAEGGPVTVTHRDVERYFMTIPEAVQLVLQAGALAARGDIFVFDMGKQIKIYDLAYDLIQMSGLTPGKDIEIKLTGLRPGEKLFEELRLDRENVDFTSHEKIFICKANWMDEKLLDTHLHNLRAAVEKDDAEHAVDALFTLVPSIYRKPVIRTLKRVE